MVLLVPLAVVLFTLAEAELYLSGLTIIVLTIAAFFLHFESRKPQARELVLLAVLCALAVASPGSLRLVPHFKPMLAIVMLTALPSARRRAFSAEPSAALPATSSSARGPGPRGRCLPTASAGCWRVCSPCAAF